MAMKYKLPSLPYPYDALAPHIDALTMEIHHLRHHGGYVRRLNDALDNCPHLIDRPLEALISDMTIIPEPYRLAIRNNGGGHLNHRLFWRTMSPAGGGEPIGALADAIRFRFGGFDGFVEQFTQVALTHFGSGWAWLGLDETGRLEVLSTPNQDSPLMVGVTPILALDLWEHAYYLTYHNRRDAYIEAWWNVVNWATAAEQFSRSRERIRPILL